MGGVAARRALAGLLAAAAAACAAPPVKDGVYHVVRPGETVWRISRHYGVPVERVVDANGIADVTRVRSGARLFIPGGRGVQPATALPWRRPPARGPAAGARALDESDLVFDWPLAAPVTSAFGRRSGRPHEGVDLAAPRGTPVRAAEAGRVIYSGDGMRDYGNVVIIKHVGRFATVYAHNRRNLVGVGAFVEQGDVIAEVGDTGNASRPHLHFEVRRGDRPLDPMGVLP